MRRHLLKACSVTPRGCQDRFVCREAGVCARRAIRTCVPWHGHIVIRSGAPYAKQRAVVSSRRARQGIAWCEIKSSLGFCKQTESKMLYKQMISHHNERERETRREREGGGGRKAGGVRVLGPWPCCSRSLLRVAGSECKSDHPHRYHRPGGSLPPFKLACSRPLWNHPWRARYDSRGDGPLIMAGQASKNGALGPTPAHNA